MRSPCSARRVFASSRPMMRSASRTDETSGLATTIARSEKRIASVAPRSMPAGLSQMIQSNHLRISSMTRPTPSSVRASLSRVCEAGRRKRFSSLLSRTSAWGSLASPWATLIRSYTTRRSAPMTRSRLRKPTSKSTTATLWFSLANAAPIAAVDVVLPTPPLPEVTTTTLDISSSLSIKPCDLDGVVLEPGLDGLAAHIRVDLVRGDVEAADHQELGLEAAAEDAGARLAIGARHGAAAQAAID